MTNFGIFLASVAFGFAVLFAIILGPLMLFSIYQCSSYETVTGKATKHEGGMCYIQDKGEWYAWEEYKHRLITKGMMK